MYVLRVAVYSNISRIRSKSIIAIFLKIKRGNIKHILHFEQEANNRRSSRVLLQIVQWDYIKGESNFFFY